MIVLTPLQQDAITELLNIGMGRASAALSEMVNEDVLLSIPLLEFLTRKEAVDKIKQLVGDEVTAIKEEFAGSFWGNALLLFPEKQSLSLVRALLRDQDLPMDVLSEMEQEALTEVGNIILNACLGSLANIIEQNLNFELPQYSHGSCEEVIQSSCKNSGEGILLLQMSFSLASTRVQGYLTLVMDVDSMQALSEQLNQYFNANIPSQL